jgi:hypothetical protein
MGIACNTTPVFLRHKQSQLTTAHKAVIILFAAVVSKLKEVMAFALRGGGVALPPPLLQAIAERALTSIRSIMIFA